jgi:hypothetical protein
VISTAVTCFLFCCVYCCHVLLFGFFGEVWTCIKIGVFGVMFLWFVRKGRAGVVEWWSGRWWEVVVVVVMVMLARWCLMRLDRSMSLLESRPNYPEGVRYQLHIFAKLGSLPEIRLQHSRPIQHPCPLHHRVNFILKNCLRQYHSASSGRGAE